MKWRNGRPRWEPSPANRASGLKGLDLRTADGGWMDRGAAMSAADGRTLWASFIRNAQREGEQGVRAREMLREALARLSATPRDGHTRSLVQDLVDRGFAVLGDRPPDILEPIEARTVAAMIQQYLDDDQAMSALAVSSRRSYRTQSKKLLAKFGSVRVDAITRPQMRAWYLELLETTSIASANQIIGVAGALFQWAMWQDPAWIDTNPCTKLGKKKAKGRRVFWEFAEEKAFVTWCDDNGYPDVADCVVVCLWTGARQSDVCAADLADLSGSTWRYMPIKTRKREQEALPGLLQPVKARVQRRLVAARLDRLVQLSALPFLWNPRTQKRHTSKSISDLTREAKLAAVEAGALPETFLQKRLQDTRDTCVTRLFDAGVPLDRIPPWTGHAGHDAENILREHYLILREHGALETATTLERYAAVNGFSLTSSEER